VTARPPLRPTRLSVPTETPVICLLARPASAARPFRSSATPPPGLRTRACQCRTTQGVRPPAQRPARQQANSRRPRLTVPPLPRSMPPLSRQPVRARWLRLALWALSSRSALRPLPVPPREDAPRACLASPSAVSSTSLSPLTSSAPHQQPIIPAALRSMVPADLPESLRPLLAGRVASLIRRFVAVKSVDAARRPSPDPLVRRRSLPPLPASPPPA